MAPSWSCPSHPKGPCEAVRTHWLLPRPFPHLAGHPVPECGHDWSSPAPPAPAQSLASYVLASAAVARGPVSSEGWEGRRRPFRGRSLHHQAWASSSLPGPWEDGSQAWERTGKDVGVPGRGHQQLPGLRMCGPSYPGPAGPLP